MSKLHDLTGQRFGRLTVVSRAENEKGGQARWLCICDCGGQTVARGRDLRAGVTNSCGCYQRERASASSRKYPYRDNRIWRIWRAMKRRCYDKHTQFYPIYGGRGIQVCPEWRDDFEAFQTWALSHGYGPNLTLDRIDNDRDYSPENCRWADAYTQANNHRNNRVITCFGVTQNLTQWSRSTGISFGTLNSRIAAGWSIEDALTIPPGQHKKANK